MVVGKAFFCNPNNPCVIFVSRYLGYDSPGLSESPTNVPILSRENDIEHSPRFPLNLLPKHDFIHLRSYIKFNQRSYIKKFSQGAEASSEIT